MINIRQFFHYILDTFFNLKNVDLNLLFESKKIRSLAYLAFISVFFLSYPSNFRNIPNVPVCGR